jgi:hypothetical protein
MWPFLSAPLLLLPSHDRPIEVFSLSWTVMASLGQLYFDRKAQTFFFFFSILDLAIPYSRFVSDAFYVRLLKETGAIHL